jgi:type IV pilus assembly protein PilO
MFAIAGLIYFLRILLVQDQLVAVRREWAAQRKQLSQRTQLGKAEQFDAGMRDYSRFASRIPVKNDFAKVIGGLFEYADNNSLSVGSVTYKPINNASGYIEYNINIDVTGTYGGIKSFLSDLSQTNEIIAVDSVSFSKGSKMFEEEVTLRATLTILFGQVGS